MQTFSRARSTIVPSGQLAGLPGEAECDAVRLRLQLPDRDEMRQLAHGVLKSLRAQHSFEVSLGPDGMNAVVTAIGLTPRRYRADPRRRTRAIRARRVGARRVVPLRAIYVLVRGARRARRYGPATVAARIHSVRTPWVTGACQAGGVTLAESDPLRRRS